MSIQSTTLPGGLRVVTDTITTVDSVALGVWAGVGTRHEDIAVNGVAHMVEHMLFKGTTTRTAGQIAEEIENVGGNINAYTSREITAYHIHLLKEHAGLGIDILADLIQNSTLPEDEIDRERKVILQEIGMSIDTPDDYVFDNYQETAYPGQSLGAPILGRAAIIETMQRTALRDYIRRCYTPGRLIVSAAGNIDHDRFTALVARAFSALPADGDLPTPGAQYRGGEHRMERDLEQSHVVLGFRSIGRHDPRYYTAVALSTVLGGGMSSRLFQEVREKRGLVYSVFSFHSAYDDDGQFAIYAGTGPDRLRELVPVICDELKKIAAENITPAELDRTRAQMRANLLMARESMMTRAGQQAKHMIHFNACLDIDRILDTIAAVTADDIRALAAQIFSGNPTLAGLGPLKNLDSHDQIRARLAA